MSFTAAIEDMFKSVYELFAAVLGTIVGLVQTVFSTILGFFTGLINLVTDVFSGVIDVVGGVGKFVAGNIVILGILAAGGFLYVRSQQQQGRPVVPAKKTN